MRRYWNIGPLSSRSVYRNAVCALFGSSLPVRLFPLRKLPCHRFILPSLLAATHFSCWPEHSCLLERILPLIQMFPITQDLRLVWLKCFGCLCRSSSNSEQLANRL